MRILQGMAVAATALLLATGASAQVVGIGTAQRGATVTIGQEIARIVSGSAGMQMRSQGFASTGQYAPRVNAGELEFGLANVIETNFAFLGTDANISGGRPQENLRLAVVLYALPITFFTPASSDIHTPEDLRGKRVPVGWTSQALGDWLFRGFFANHDLPYPEGVNGVPVTAMPRMWDMFPQGQLDFAFAVYGSSFQEELASRVGGVRFLDLNEDPAAVERMREHLPFSYVSTDYNPNTGTTVRNISYDFVVFTSSEVSDDVVYRVVKALHEGQEALEGIYSAENRRVRFAVESGVPFHAGAERFYREIGMWPPQAQ